MRENVKMEVAFEILGMRIAMAREENDTEKINKLNKERELLYDGNKDILNKVYSQYAKEVKTKIGGESNE